METNTYRETNRIHAEMIAAGVPCYINGHQAATVARMYGASALRAWEGQYGRQIRVHRLEVAERIAEHNEIWN